MRTIRYRTLVASLLILGAHFAYAATASTPSSIVIQISPGSSSLDLISTDHAATVRQATTPVRITVAGTTPGIPHRIAVYACVDTDDAMRLPDKPSTVATTNLRIRNAQGDWTSPEPIAQLGGRRGVRIAVLNRTSAEILLQVQLQVPGNQPPGVYQGVLMVLAQEQE